MPGAPGRDSAIQFSSYTLPDAPSFSKEGGGGECFLLLNAPFHLSLSDSFARAKGETFAFQSKCRAKEKPAESEQRPMAGDSGFSERLDACFYLGMSDSFAQAKGETFAPPFLSHAWERKRRAAVERADACGRVAPPALPASVLSHRTYNVLQKQLDRRFGLAESASRGMETAFQTVLQRLWKKLLVSAASAPCTPVPGPQPDKGTDSPAAHQRRAGLGFEY